MKQKHNITSIYFVYTTEQTLDKTAKNFKDPSTKQDKDYL